MRRAIRPFAVEVRRRPRLVAAANPDAQSSRTKSAAVVLDRESQRPAVAALWSQEPDRSSGAVAASRPTGRILPSLVPDKSWNRLLEDVPISVAEPPSRAPKRPSVRASKRGDEASNSSRTSSFSADENAPLPVRSSTKSRRTSRVQSEEGVNAAPRQPTRAPSQVVGGSRELASSSKGRKRTIMVRYVFGDEDKPGARWKGRLLRSR